MNLLFSFIIFILVSCASSNSTAILKGKTIKYDYTDASGEYLIVRETGFSSDKKQFITKRAIYNRSEELIKPVEQTISISSIGKMKMNKNTINILRPEISQFKVWFNKQKYFSELKLDPKSKSMVNRLESPEYKWNGQKNYKFPQNKGIFCFFSQIVECALRVGFVQKSIDEDVGRMNFFIIWDGFPFFQQIYVNIPEQVFSPASFIYDGVNSFGDARYTLRAAGQSIFIHVDKKNYEFKKMFWVSQGVSMVKSEIQ